MAEKTKKVEETKNETKDNVTKVKLKPKKTIEDNIIKVDLSKPPKNNSEEVEKQPAIEEEVIVVNEEPKTEIEETTNKTTIGSWMVGDIINLERAMKIGDRLDGHMIQGHVDQVGKCTYVEEKNGSWEFIIEYKKSNNITVEKGSIAVNGISLTVIDSKTTQFKVAIIPYTYHNTSFKTLKKDDAVNLEFDILGKYLTKMALNYK